MNADVQFVLLLLPHAFFIRDSSKKSPAKNPKELGGARTVWASMCKLRMVSAVSAEFP